MLGISMKEKILQGHNLANLKVISSLFVGNQVPRILFSTPCEVNVGQLLDCCVEVAVVAFAGDRLDFANDVAPPHPSMEPCASTDSRPSKIGGGVSR